jgi:hypothetical protein
MNEPVRNSVFVHHIMIPREGPRDGEPEKSGVETNVHGVKEKAILTDNGREYCGRPDAHPYELMLQLEDIEHRRDTARHPQVPRVHNLKRSHQGLPIEGPHPGSGAPEPVNDFEALIVRFHWAASSVRLSRGLVQTASGRGEVLGRRKLTPVVPKTGTTEKKAAA